MSDVHANDCTLKGTDNFKEQLKSKCKKKFQRIKIKDFLVLDGSDRNCEELIKK